MLLALIGFMPTEGVGAIGSLDAPPEERRRLAAMSRDWVCTVCQVPNKDLLVPMREGQEGSHQQTMAEAADIVNQMAFKVNIPSDCVWWKWSSMYSIVNWVLIFESQIFLFISSLSLVPISMILVDLMKKGSLPLLNLLC